MDDVVKSNLRQVPFGFDFYNPPKVERAYLKGKNYTMDKSKNTNFAELEAKNKSFVPGPAYNTTYDWSLMIKGNRGKFLQ